ncbi:MAG: hypothetical protein JNL08_11090 [Planctomycetes bacterium]|nr:hypothetical protein [Planctomycetota bacterium]
MRAVAPLALLLAACVTEPPLGVRPSPLASLGRPLQPDWTASAMARRAAQIHELWLTLAAEPQRAARLAQRPAGLAARELRRPEALAAAARQVAGDELHRPAAWETDSTAIVRSLTRGDLRPAAQAEPLARLLGLAHPPLGELHDRRHRTDPEEERAEATLLQRLVRRLRL